MKPNHYNKIIQTTTLLIIAIIYLHPADAFGKLSAEANLHYTNYDVKDNTGQHLSAHSLTQQYSLLYQTAGKLAGGRLGMYDLSLGYNWDTFDTKISSTTGNENPQGSRGKILYQGEILISPKELPFRFTAFSRDKNKNTLTTDEYRIDSALLGGSLEGRPQLVTGISNSMSMESGATLVMGVKNGMTNGYNELLRHFPMLMLDYRDEINRDLNSAFPVDNRTSRLAFVSLNKKDNWFHYRLTNYEDQINHFNNYKETQYQLGTVDHLQQRRWIDFANWLQISADGLLTKRTSAVADGFTEFGLNLFGVARRADWEARSYNNFIRNKDDRGLITYLTSVPLYASGSISADTGWNSHVSYKESHDNKNSQFTDLSGGYRIDAFKRANFTLSQQLELEKSSSNGNELLMISGAVETTSTSRFSRTVGLGAMYNIRNSSTDGKSGSNNFLDQLLKMNASYAPSNQTHIKFTQTNQLTSGNFQSFGSNLPGATISSPQYTDPNNNQILTKSSFHSVSDLAFDWTPLARLNIGFSLNEDLYLPDNAPNIYKTNFTNSVTFDTSTFKLSSRNSLSRENTGATSEYHYLYVSDIRANYIFSRNLDTRLWFKYNSTLHTTNEANTLTVSQQLNYYYYKTSGFSRKYFEINESAEYSDVGSASGGYYNPSTGGSNAMTLSLGGKYYPFRQLILAGGARYSFYNNINNYYANYYGSIALNFRLIQASLDYMYGSNRADGRIEKKINANFKKIF